MKTKKKEKIQDNFVLSNTKQEVTKIKQDNFLSRDTHKKERRVN